MKFQFVSVCETDSNSNAIGYHLKPKTNVFQSIEYLVMEDWKVLENLINHRGSFFVFFTTRLVFNWILILCSFFTLALKQCKKNSESLDLNKYFR